MGTMLAKGGHKECVACVHVDIFADTKLEFELSDGRIRLWIGSPITTAIYLRPESLRRLAELAGQAVQAYDDCTATVADGLAQAGELPAQEARYHG